MPLDPHVVPGASFDRSSWRGHPDPEYAAHRVPTHRAPPNDPETPTAQVSPVQCVPARSIFEYAAQHSVLHPSPDTCVASVMLEHSVKFPRLKAFDAIVAHPV
jgi:hypothetical protein